MPVREAFFQFGKLQVNNLPDVFSRELLEDHYFIYPIEEFRAELGLQGVHSSSFYFLFFFRAEFGYPLASQIAGLDKNRVLEVYGTAVSICQTAVVQYL